MGTLDNRIRCGVRSQVLAKGLLAIMGLLVAAYPEQTATYLAVLVALDMQMRAEQACGDARPSAN